MAESQNDPDDLIGGELLSIDQAAPLLGIRPNSLRQLCRERKIRHMKVGPSGGLYRFRRQWLGEYLESCTVKPKGRRRRRRTEEALPDVVLPRDKSTVSFLEQAKKLREPA